MTQDPPRTRRLGAAWEPSTRPKRASATISRDEVVRAAIVVLDADGLAAVSMRRVASALGVGVTTLYWHVADKEELLDLVCDAVLADAVAGVADHGSWRKKLVSAMAGLRRCLLAHGDLAVYFAARPNVGPNALALRESIASSLFEAGLSPTAARSVDRILLGYTTGACCNELAARSAAEERGESPRQVEATIGSFLAALPGTDFPALVRLGRRSRFREPDKDFLLGLECLLRGVEAGLPTS